MKALILLVLIQASFSWAVVNHAGHNHSTGEECDVAGMPSATGAALAADVLWATEKLNPDQKYCDAISACSSTGSYKSGVSRGPACEITVTPTCGLEGREVAAIHYYTSSGYMCFNQFIWKKEEGPVSGGVETLDEALEKLPKVVGFVQRGTELPSFIREQHTVGATVTYDAFTSTSTGSGFSDSDNFLIYSQTGRPVMSLSSISEEDEVLFQTKTKFRVVSIKEEHETRFYLMREVIGSETDKQAKQEDERITALAQELKNKKKELSYSETRATRRWECPVGEGVIPTEFKLENRPSRIDSFL